MAVANAVEEPVLFLQSIYGIPVGGCEMSLCHYGKGST